MDDNSERVRESRVSTRIERLCEIARRHITQMEKDRGGNRGRGRRTG